MDRQDDGAQKKRCPDGFRILQGKQEYVTYIDQSSVRIWYSDIPTSYDAHSHSAVEIIVPIRGEVLYELPGQNFHVQSDEVLIVPPDTLHALTMGENCARQLFLFEPNSVFAMRDMKQVEDLVRAPVYITGQSPLAPKVRALLLEAAACYEAHAPMWNTLCYAYLFRLYAMIGRDYLEHAPGRADADRHTETAIMDSARLYIDQNYMKDITLETVSAFTGFSQCYFSRVFKQQLGVSFSAYLRRKRIDMAENLLVHSSLPIQEIALSAGFGSIATFNRVFRGEKGCPPSKYREIYGDMG